MKINKLFWIFGLVFVLSSASVFAFSLSDIYRNSWFILFVNVLIVWSILFVAQLFIITSQDTRVKIVVWIVTLALAILIVWNYTPRGAAYLWEAGWIAQYLGIKFLVNTAILSIAIFYLAGFLAIVPQTPQGRIGLVAGAILLGGMIAYNLPADTWIWKEDNVKQLWNYLRGPQGILTIDRANLFESRLFIFITSTMLFAWFFTSYIPTLGQASPKLTYIMAFIIGAQLARQGTTSGTLIGIGEAFAILIIGGEVAKAFGGKWYGWIIGVVLVEWIFCAVFGQSRIMQVIGEVLKALLGSSTFVLIILSIYLAIKIGGPLGLIAGGLGLLGSFVNLLGNPLGTFVAWLIRFDICQILAKHTIVTSTGGAVRTLGILGNAAWTGNPIVDNLAGLIVWTSAGGIAFLVYRGTLKLLGRS